MVKRLQKKKAILNYEQYRRGLIIISNISLILFLLNCDHQHLPTEAV